MPRPVFPPLALPKTGRYRNKHPFLVHLGDWVERPGNSKKKLAALVGIENPSLYTWIEGCEKQDPENPYRIQAERVPVLSLLFEIEPCLLRPDLYPKGFKFDPKFVKLPKEATK